MRLGEGRGGRRRWHSAPPSVAAGPPASAATSQPHAGDVTDSRTGALRCLEPVRLEERLVVEDRRGRAVRHDPPPSITIVRGNTSATRRMSWVDTSIVCSSARSSPMSSRRPRGSRPADGSSKTRIDGSIDSTVATATRFRWPSDIRCGTRRSKPAIPTEASAASTRRWTSSAPRPMWSGPNATSSNTVGLNSWSSGSWNTSPTSRRTSRIVGLPTARPATRTVPVARAERAVELEHERALAGAVRADQRDLLAVLDPQVDAVQRLEPVRVAEVDVGELYRPAAGQRLGASSRSCSWTCGCACGAEPPWACSCAWRCACPCGSSWLVRVDGLGRLARRVVGHSFGSQVSATSSNATRNRRRATSQPISTRRNGRAWRWRNVPSNPRACIAA